MPRQPRIRIPLTERPAARATREDVERLRAMGRHQVEEAQRQWLADEPNVVRRRWQPEDEAPRRPDEPLSSPQATHEWVDVTQTVTANAPPPPPDQNEIVDSILDEIRHCENDLRRVTSQGDRYEQDYFAGRINSLHQQLRELEGDEPYRETGYVVSNNARFADFLINSQKAQVGLVNSSRRFQFAIQTNRETYLRKVIALTETKDGLALRRQAIDRSMRHGLRVVLRRDGYFVILERKEDMNVTDSR